jgi:murein L,D-transpeptidase YcbB/YkuD
MRNWATILLISICAYSCNISGNGHENSISSISNVDTIFPKELAGNFSDQKIIKLDSTAIEMFLNTHEHFNEFRKELFNFYRNRKYAMAWFDTTGMIEQSNILFNRIVKMKDDGLRLDIPYYDEYIKNISVADDTDRVLAELMQTSQYLHFARKLVSGIPEEISTTLEWYIPRKKIDYSKFLQNTLEGDTTAVNAYLFPQYDLLKLQLARFHQIENDGGWDSIKMSKRYLKYGDTGRVITAIKNRLLKTGEFTTTDSSTIFDAELEMSVRKFQQSHGLKPDGIVNKTTLSEMNISVVDRIQQIIINMERCRWLANETQQAYIMVNIPQFKLYVFEKDSLVFDCKVVVGKETNRTAIFKGNMKYVVFSPYWNVPPNILKKEVLPAIRKNNNYLSINNMEWFNNGVRQLPGPWNALGGVKFLFPNGYDIYLHDTPSKSLFNESTRTFSHGCIRISEPKRLAMYLLADQQQWTSESIDSAMSSRIEKFVPLKKPVPVYVVYFTAFVDSDGVLNFSKDVYGRDEKLKRMILN